MTQNNNFSYHV